ncbi:MAG: hypothetical protein GXP35_06615 [Actinobacteria bacterium]|nr:hypothetical protein [Actinomycetota bacterium]
MSLRHPSHKRLAGWLDTGDVDEGLETHVEQCTRCADELERIAGDDAPFDSALSMVLEPTPGLEDRMAVRLAAAMRNRELLMSMFGSAAQTAKILFDPPDATT